MILVRCKKLEKLQCAEVNENYEHKLTESHIDFALNSSAVDFIYFPLN